MHTQAGIETHPVDISDPENPVKLLYHKAQYRGDENTYFIADAAELVHPRFGTYHSISSAWSYLDWHEKPTLHSNKQHIVFLPKSGIRHLSLLDLGLKLE